MASRVLLALLSSAFSFWLGLQLTHAAIFNVADGDVAALVSAITTTNTNGEDDTINLAANGTYTLTTVDNTFAGETGLPVILSDGGHSLTINGSGATITRSTAQGTPAFRIFCINGGTVNISGLTISNGMLSGDTTNESLAGGMLIGSSGAVTLNNCNLVGNVANGTRGNSGEGGAIAASADPLTVTNCNFHDNQATGSTKSKGGAISLGRGTVTVNNSTFSQNTTSGDGGAIINSGTMTIINSTIANNSANGGGGICGNTTSGSGGLTLINDTISGNSLAANSTESGGGIMFFGNSQVVLGNTIVAGNSGSSHPDISNLNGSGLITSNGHNLIGQIDGSSGWVASDLTGTVAHPLDPKLGLLQTNGGLTPTMALLANSPAIDAGDDSVLSAPDNLTSDERGFPRAIGSHVDIGAYELDHAQIGNTLTVTTTSDEGDGICGVAHCTLRDAIIAVNAAGGKTVQFAAGVSGTITLTHGTLTIQKAVTVIGPGARVLAVDANLATRILDIDASGFMIAISGLTFTRGQVIAASGDSAQGGGINNREGTNTVFTNCTISGSSVISDAGQLAFGGGIYSEGTLTLIGCTVSGNSAIGGSYSTNSNSVATGGTGEGGGIFGDGSLTLQNCTFSANTAQGGRGGHNPLLGSGHGGPGGNGHGGAILYVGKTGMTATNCTFSGNFALGGPGGTGKTNGPNGVGQGGGVEHGNTFSNLVVGNTLIAGNTGADNAPDIFGSFTSNGFNLIGKADGGSGFTTTGDKTGTIATPLDPKIGSLANNGGQTDTIALLTGSPAIDAGNDANARATDQRGASRAGISDIGAYEFGGVVPTPTPTPTPTGTPTATPSATPTATPGSLGNVSTRLQVGTGNNVLFAGFIIQGSGSKTLLIRSAGPSLTPFGVPGAMGNPQLELHDANNIIGTNDNWQTTQIGGVITSDQVAAIQNSGAAPADPAEPAIIAALPAGSYTAIVQGVGSTQGVATVEVYDLSPNNGAILANISTRGFIQTGDNVMIGGFIVVGQASRVLVRATGPSLIPFGVNNALANPRLELHDANGTLAINDDWQTTQLGGIIASDQSGAIQNSGLAPSNPAESAIIATLVPGNYTAIAQGVSGGTGVGLVEVFALP